MECIEQGRGSRATAFGTLARGDCARQLLELVYPRHFHGGGGFVLNSTSALQFSV